MCADNAKAAVGECLLAKRKCDDGRTATAYKVAAARLQLPGGGFIELAKTCAGELFLNAIDRMPGAGTKVNKIEQVLR